MKKLLAIFIFYFLFFAFSSSPARAEVVCPSGGFPQEPDRLCCNYEDSPNHIPDPSTLCTAEPRICQKENFGVNPDGNTFGGACNYCNPNVAKYGDACDETCNWSCTPPDDDDDGEEEEDCRMEEDENLIACCPVTKGAPPSLLTKIIELIEGAFSDLIPVKLRVVDFRVSEKFEEAADYYYGSVHSPFEEGVFFKLAPPNLLQEYFPTEEAKVEKRDENAQWAVGTTIESGERGGEDALNDGSTKNVEPYRLAVNNLRDFLVGIPKTENGTSSQKESETRLASSPPRSSDPDASDNVLGMTETDLCSPPVDEAETKKTCTPTDIKGKGLTPEDILKLITGGFKLFPKVVDLDFLGNNTAGIPTDPDGAAAKDTNYGPGFLEIFKLPGEEYEPRNAEGSAELQAVVSILGADFPISFGRQKLELSYEGTDSYERENSVWPKLTVPKAENGAAAYKSPETSAVVLASAKTPLDNPVAPLSPLTPLNTSFAERVGRTLGTWLRKLITL